MAEQTNKNQEQNIAQPASPQGRPCPKDCRLCTMAQQICCASLLTFQSFEVMYSIIQRLDILSQRITELESHLSAIQPSGTELSSPCFSQGDLFPSKD